MCGVNPNNIMSDMQHRGIKPHAPHVPYSELSIAAPGNAGIPTVAVFSDADRAALHVRMADEAVHIGRAPATESYLRSDVINEVGAVHGPRT